ncbi:hypothetical protein Trydic_g19089 [Trypoxylus dichotomus]
MRVPDTYPCGRIETLDNRRIERVQQETAWCHGAVWVALWDVYLERRREKEDPSREVPETASSVALFVLDKTPSIDLVEQKRTEIEHESDTSGESIRNNNPSSCMDQNTNTGPKALGTAEHTFFECPTCAPERQKPERTIGHVASTTIV